MGDGAADQKRLAVEAAKLTRLAKDLDGMQEYLDRQVRRMDAIVDRIEARWRGPAADDYRARHREAAEDAVRIRESLKKLAQAVRLSEGGFTAQELDVMQRFRRVRAEADIKSEVDALSTPHSAAVPGAASRSNLSDL